MSENQFGPSPKKSISAELEEGHPQPTPYHVVVHRNGFRAKTEKFSQREEAEAFQRSVPLVRINAKRP